MSIDEDVKLDHHHHNTMVVTFLEYFQTVLPLPTSIITTTSWIIFGGDGTMGVNCANK